MGVKLDAILKSTNKKFKEEILTQGLGDFNYARIPFTSPRMNYCTFGGIPVGKITEFYGEEHGGKTTTALDIVANFQHSDDGREVLYIDAENTLDVRWAEKIGVDIDKMYILQPKSQSAEEIFQIICEAVDSGEVGLWVLDSIGALLSKQELEKDMDEVTYGGISKPLTKFGKRIEMLMHRHKCTGIGINQERDDMNSTWGGTKTPGGRAWKHFCAVRMQFVRGHFFDADGKKQNRNIENPVGNVVLMSMVKNKTCPPTRRTGRYTLNYEYGIDYLEDLIEVAIKYDIVNKSGAWFTVTDIETGEMLSEKIQGQHNVKIYLDEHREVLTRVEELIDKKILETAL